MRTEQEVLKDFEKMGYIVEKRYDKYLKLREEWDNIVIYFEDKTYSKSFGTYDSVSITVEEHKLLHELLQIWGWIK